MAVGDPDTPDPTEAPEDIDPGEPISLLAGLAVAPRLGFFDRIWDSIERRQLGGSFIELVWHVPFVVLRELLVVVSGLLRPAGEGEGERD